MEQVTIETQTISKLAMLRKNNAPLLIKLVNITKYKTYWKPPSTTTILFHYPEPITQRKRP
jgi:hypothetical protein